MDMNENSHSFVLEKKHGDDLIIHSSGASSDCQFYSQAMSMVPAASSFMTPVTLSAYPLAPVVENHHNNSNYIHVGKPVAMSSRGMLMPTIPGISPPIHPHCPSDFAFVERAVRFSCFNSGNSGSINPFGLSPDALKVAMGAQLQETGLDRTDKKVAMGPVVDHSSINVNSIKTQRDHGSSHICISNSSSNEGKNSSGDPAGNSSSSNIGANKRRRTIQNMEDQVQRGPQTSLETTKERVEATQKEEQSSSDHGGKTRNDNSETAKEDHVHVRARRGQAISSHSLAERLRREKISERMKCLQELVPGCSKVTGKAVMLDEIINYVQSLQRQVEFLSMKLAAVNPQLDFITEDVLAKNVLHSQAGLSSSGFSQEINYPQMYPSQQGLLHVGISTMVNSLDAYRRAMNTQLPNTSGYEEPSVQALNEEHAMKMPYGAHPPLNTQETDSKPDGFTM